MTRWAIRLAAVALTAIAAFVVTMLVMVTIAVALRQWVSPDAAVYGWLYGTVSCILAAAGGWFVWPAVARATRREHDDA